VEWTGEYDLPHSKFVELRDDNEANGRPARMIAQGWDLCFYLLPTLGSPRP